ncbi:hypothetical protein TYRP_003999, partial [Tyrophagus putrescentiae]
RAIIRGLAQVPGALSLLKKPFRVLLDDPSLDFCARATASRARFLCLLRLSFSLRPLSSSGHLFPFDDVVGHKSGAGNGAGARRKEIGQPAGALNGQLQVAVAEGVAAVVGTVAAGEEEEAVEDVLEEGGQHQDGHRGNGLGAGVGSQQVSQAGQAKVGAPADHSASGASASSASGASSSNRTDAGRQRRTSAAAAAARAVGRLHCRRPSTSSTIANRSALLVVVVDWRLARGWAKTQTKKIGTPLNNGNRILWRQQRQKIRSCDISSSGGLTVADLRSNGSGGISAS